jgi:hypothetical protein
MRRLDTFRSRRRAGFPVNASALSHKRALVQWYKNAASNQELPRARCLSASRRACIISAAELRVRRNTTHTSLNDHHSLGTSTSASPSLPAALDLRYQALQPASNTSTRNQVGLACLRMKARCKQRRATQTRTAASCLRATARIERIPHEPAYGRSILCPRGF